jgi:hypothetical protein
LGHLAAIGPCVHSGNTTRCVADGPGYVHSLYEPASRFWSMQLVELGLFGGIALVLLVFAAWWTSARTT